MLTGKGQHFIGTANRLGRTGHQGGAHLQGNFAGRHFVPQGFNGVRGGANPDQARIQHGLGKVSAFGQKAIARVHGVGTAAPGDIQQFVDAQVAVLRPRAVQRPGFIGCLYMQGLGIRVGINGHRWHAVIAAGAGDAHGNFAPVGNKHFGNRSGRTGHGQLLRQKRERENN